MDILSRFGGSASSHGLPSRSPHRSPLSPRLPSPPPTPPLLLKPYCSRRGPSSPRPQNNGDSNSDKK
ncbi:hypothetical protein CRG98_017558, partial [Punica granatum]